MNCGLVLLPPTHSSCNGTPRDLQRKSKSSSSNPQPQYLLEYPLIHSKCSLLNKK